MRSSEILLTLFFMIPLFCKAQDGSSIVEKMDQHLRGKTSKSKMTIKVVRPDWTQTKKIKTWSKGNDYAMVLVTAPSREEGTAFLKRGDEIWNWVPRVERTIKLPPSMMSQSWMGTDFTNDDLVEQASMVTDYKHKKVGDSTIRGRDCYEVRLTPKEGKAVVWGKVKLYIGKEHSIEMRSEYYDETGELINVMKSYDVKKIGGRQMAERMEMIPQDKAGHKTVMIREKMSFNETIEDSFFTTRKMKSLR
ncbi:MAG: outer membrane lipoprotein-sorting protein [Flavobacteriales bacterium]